MTTYQATESSRLLAHHSAPDTSFSQTFLRERRKRVKQFQCCMCTLMLTILAAGFVIMFAFSINEDVDTSGDNSSVVANLTNETFPELILFNVQWPLPDPFPENETCDNTTWSEAIEAGMQGLIEKDEIENTIPSLALRSPSYRHQKVVATSEKARNMSRIGLIEEYATRFLHRNKSDNKLVKKICKDNTLHGSCWSTQDECNLFHKYRTYNGTCNNLNHPTLYGAAYTPFRRQLQPDYADVMLAVWGQFLDHDITATALSNKANGSTISCCDMLGTITSPECFPVILDLQDPIREYNVTCMEFVRSSPAPTCCLSAREQLNQATAYIDASVMYGCDENVTRHLREMKGGRMKMLELEDGRSLLPVSENPNDGCNREEQEKDGSMHLIWLRQHNLLAKNLSRLNPHWDDETIFQETRRIIAAQMQHITYKEFLPILLGAKLMKKLDLSPLKTGYWKKYNSSVVPNIANNFAAASFRFAHSIIPGLMKLLAGRNATPEFVQMHKMLFNPFELYQKGRLDEALRGAMGTSIQASDPYFTDELKSHMFEDSVERMKQPKLCGLDLVSLNIQRGRDHGLPGYVFWRERCGFKKPAHFDDLESFMDSDFVRLKYGDRFWYETDQHPAAFSAEQLRQIRKTSLANIICDNSDDLDVMEQLGKKNKYVNCSEIDRPNLSAWKEKLNQVQMFDDKTDVRVLNLIVG
nr:unnamed protein product [Callosobruchus chinensis]